MPWLQSLTDLHSPHHLVLSSRNATASNILYREQRMRQSGIFVTTSEAVIFELLGDSQHARFKDVQALIKTSAPNSGLVPSSK